MFFLGGAQIDGEANINLVGTGEYPRTQVRFPGSFGSAFMYFTAKRTILFREEHSKRVLVPKVDFISAPGWSERRRVAPRAEPAGAAHRQSAVRVAEGEKRRFRSKAFIRGIRSMKSRETHRLRVVCAAAVAGTTPEPDAATLALLRGTVAQEIAADYPEFARRVWGRKRNRAEGGRGRATLPAARYQRLGTRREVWNTGARSTDDVKPRTRYGSRLRSAESAAA